MLRRLSPVLAAAVFAAAGCGGSKIVPVSGTVKLNGQLYKNAIVSFQPLGSKDNDNPGRGSSGRTDDQGRFTLVYDGQQPGALVGKHRVRIFTDLGAAAGDAPLDDKSESNAKVRVKFTGEPIPPEWNEYSTKEFDVPSGGTDQANFEIENPKVKN
ncbi:MAG TPA: hypothetical protein VM597_38405 [Gemmataceae bacterium]|jgi:hypothetical protein|nr:hypothetical protein [Gemmataceae bacterium]